MKFGRNNRFGNEENITSFLHLIYNARNISATKTAFQYRVAGGKREINYAEFCHDVFSIGYALSEIGTNNSHIACVSDNRYEWISSYLAVLCTAGVFVPVNTELYGTDMIELLSHSDSEVVFYSERYEYIFRENRNALSRVKYFIGFDREHDDGDFLSFASFVRKGETLLAAKENAPSRRGQDDPAMLIYTSGNNPKGVILTEKNLITCMNAASNATGGFNKNLSVMPYYRSFQAICCILTTIKAHGTLCTNDNIRNIFRDLRFYQPNILILTPSDAELIYKRIILDYKKHHTTKLVKGSIKISNITRKFGIDPRKPFFELLHSRLGGNLKSIVCSSAALAPEVGKFFDSIGIPIINCYGVTECSGLISANSENTADHRTVGTPLSCHEVRIREADIEGNGEIDVRGPAVCSGYYKNEELTKRSIDANGWFSTGDYGHIDESGRLVITGRKDHRISLPNGYNIHPEEIEGYIRTVPYIEEAVVYALKDNKGKKVALCAEIYLGEAITHSFEFSDYTDRVASDIAKALRKLPAHKQISEVVVRAQDFPRNSTGKIKRDNVGF